MNDLPKILILHNNKTKLKELHHAFVIAGYDVLFAKDGMYGEQLFHEEKPDCLIADLLLSGKSGGDLALAIKNSPEGRMIPVVLTSPQFQRTQLEQTARKKWKVDRYISEPYEMNEMIKAVDDLVRKYFILKKKGDAAENQPEMSQPAKSLPEHPPDTALERTAKPRPTAKKAREEELFGDLDIFGDIGAEVADMAREVADSVDIMELVGKPGRPAVPAGGEVRNAWDGLVEGAPQMPEEGTLGELSIPELFATAFLRKIDGTLEVKNSEGVTKIVYFRNGEPIYVEGDVREETLGQVLVRHGIISEGTALNSLENMSSQGKKMGGALLDMGAVTPMQLYQGLKLQMREKLLGLFTWDEGKFFFDKGQVETHNLTVFEINPVEVLLDGLNENFKPELMRELFETSAHQTVRMRWSSDQIALVKLPPPCLEILSLIDGKRTIGQIFKQSDLERIEAARVLYALLLLGAYEADSEPEAPQALAEPDELHVPTILDSDYDFDALLSDELESELMLDEEMEVEFDSPYSEDYVRIDQEKPSAKGEPESQSNKSGAITGNDLDDAFKMLDARMEQRKLNQGDDNKDQYAVKAKVLVQMEKESPAGMNPEDRKVRDQILLDFLALEGSNHFEVMKLERHAGDLEIKERYREIVKALHTDKLRNRFDEEIIEKANAIVARVTDAYRVLGDLERRREYTRRLSPDGRETRERHISSILAAEHEFSQGVSAMSRGEWASAKEHFEKAVEGFPEESVYHAHLGWAIYHAADLPLNERAARASQMLERAVKINPKADNSYYFLGIILRDNGYKEKAARMFAQAFRFNRKNVRAQNELRRLQIEKNDQRRNAVKQRRIAEGKRSDDSAVKSLITKNFSFKSLFGLKKK